MDEMANRPAVQYLHGRRGRKCGVGGTTYESAMSYQPTIGSAGEGIVVTENQVEKLAATSSPGTSDVEGGHESLAEPIGDNTCRFTQLDDAGSACRTGASGPHGRGWLPLLPDELLPVECTGEPEDTATTAARAPSASTTQTQPRTQSVQCPRSDRDGGDSGWLPSAGARRTMVMTIGTLRMSEPPIARALGGALVTLRRNRVREPHGI